MSKSIGKGILRTSAIAGAIVATSLCFAQVTYHVTELVPASGYTDSNGLAINDRGDAAGSSFGGPLNFNNVGTAWRGGQATNLGKVANGNYSQAEALNNSGVISGEGDDGSFRPQAVVFLGGVAKVIDSGANNARGIFVADSGVI